MTLESFLTIIFVYPFFIVIGLAVILMIFGCNNSSTTYRGNYGCHSSNSGYSPERKSIIENKKENKPSQNSTQKKKVVKIEEIKDEKGRTRKQESRDNTDYPKSKECPPPSKFLDVSLEELEEQKTSDSADVERLEMEQEIMDYMLLMEQMESVS